VAAGAWITQYRFIFMPVTIMLLGLSFYRTYTAKQYVPRRSKIILWTTAAVSIGLTLYSLLK
jgi:hypothetical protein